jgi:uncharacterized protein YdaU (DUF1376 family)
LGDAVLQLVMTEHLYAHFSSAGEGRLTKLRARMVSREALPNDDAALARIVGIPTTDWTRLAVKVRRFFHARNDKLWHKRCELELREQDVRHNWFRERAQKGGIAKSLKDKGLSASSMLQACNKHPCCNALHLQSKANLRR